MELSHFIFGKFNKGANEYRVPDYRELIVGSPQDKIWSKELLNKIIFQINEVSSPHPEQSFRLFFFLNGLWYYVLVLPGQPFDHSGKPVTRFHVVRLTAVQLEHIDYAPWALDPFMMGRFTGDQIVGANGEVWMTRDEYFFDIQLPKEKKIVANLSDSFLASYPNVDQEIISLCANKLKTGKIFVSLFDRENPAGAFYQTPHFSRLLISSVLKASEDLKGVAFELPRTMTGSRVSPSSVIRLASIAPGEGSAPFDNEWSEFILSPQNTSYQNAVDETSDLGPASSPPPEGETNSEKDVHATIRQGQELENGTKESVKHVDKIPVVTELNAELHRVREKNRELEIGISVLNDELRAVKTEKMDLENRNRVLLAEETVVTKSETDKEEVDVTVLEDYKRIVSRMTEKSQTLESKLKQIREEKKRTERSNLLLFYSVIALTVFLIAAVIYIVFF